MFSVPVRKQYPQRVASILFLPPSQPVNELNENGMSEDQGREKSKSFLDLMALGFPETAAWSRTLEELSQP